MWYVYRMSNLDFLLCIYMHIHIELCWRIYGDKKKIETYTYRPNRPLKLWFSDSGNLKACKSVKTSILKVWPEKQFFFYDVYIRKLKNINLQQNYNIKTQKSLYIIILLILCLEMRLQVNLCSQKRNMLKNTLLWMWFFFFQITSCDMECSINM